MSDDRLHVWSGPAISPIRLVETLARTGNPAWLYGYGYTPAAFHLFAIDHDGGIECAPGAAFQADQLFELRLFCPDWELRWRRDGSSGTAKLVADDQAVANKLGQLAPFATFDASTTPVWRRETWQLLWGEPAGDAALTGWSPLSSARIGRLWVPAELSQDCARVALTGYEYFRETGDDGNLVPWGERYSGLCEIAKRKEAVNGQ